MNAADLQRMVSMEEQLKRIGKDVQEIKDDVKNMKIVEYQVGELRTDTDQNTKDINKLKNLRGSRFEKVFDTVTATAAATILISLIKWLSGGKL